MAQLRNVKEDIRPAVAQDVLASELADALDGMFTIEHYKRARYQKALYSCLHCKPSRSVAESLLLEREVLALIANFEDVQVRTIQFANERIRSSDGRLEPGLVIVLHSDRRGGGKLRAWGLEHSLKVISVFRSKASALPAAETFRNLVAKELFSLDPFDVTGPVVDEMDFFGRGLEAIELQNQLQKGRIRPLFGLRKVGKTSLINRVVALARERKSPKIAMIDCSISDFNSLSCEGALRAVAKVAKLAAHQGYAHISEALRKTEDKLVPAFEDLWRQGLGGPLALIFDEIDYITPSSPTSSHWRQDFNKFWRELRVVFQETQRQDFPLALLVSGVSSKYFRLESIDGVENSALSFIPEGYLGPFDRGASKAMLKDLGRRCGLSWEDSDRDFLAAACGDFPYWIRMLGSYIHRAVDIDQRPMSLGRDQTVHLAQEFIEAEGAELARVALQDLQRKYPEAVARLRQMASRDQVSLVEGRVLARYGLATQRGQNVLLESGMIMRGLERVPEYDPEANDASGVETATTSHLYSVEQWAEELSTIAKRRALVERRLRDLVRYTLSLNLPTAESWMDRVRKALSEKRRAELSGLSGDQLLQKLYWLDLSVIISKDWNLFQKILSDRKKFESVMNILNDRPDAHAKDIDAADVALQRRELSWIEARLP